MAGVDIDDLEIFQEVCIGSDSDSDSNDNYSYTCYLAKYPPPLARPPPAIEKYVDFEKYIQEKCENKIKLLDRSTFHQLKRPIVIGFNHFREKCSHLCKWLDRMYQLTLKYGDRIEFIAADLLDIDVLYPHKNPIEFFCNLVRPEDESLSVYVVDEKKRIHRHYDAYQTVENLSQLCEQLLDGSLFPSQPIPASNETFVKICVHQNFEELVSKSTRDVLLIVGLGDYTVRQEEGELNYEQMAEDFQDSNVDFVYINGDKNYVPFELQIFGYPTLLFIPHNDKANVVPLKGLRLYGPVLEFIRENLNSQAKEFRQHELSRLRYKPFNLPTADQLNFEDLENYINENFPRSMKMLHSIKLPLVHKCAMIFFMDFEGKGVNFHLNSLQKIHQTANYNSLYGVEYLIADFKEMDVIFPKWYCKVRPDVVREGIEIFGIDRQHRKYSFDASQFKTAASLFYYSFSLRRSGFFYSQSLPKNNSGQLAKTCVAHNILDFIAKRKMDLFLTIYQSNCEKSSTMLNVLDEIRHDVKELGVKMVKMDGKLNYVPVEYSYSTYPVHFFIPHRNRDERTVRYTSSGQSREDILEFIQCNAQSSL